MQPVVVYDTNILFSSILWRSKPNYCIELARQNTVKGLTCQEIIEELIEILRTKAKFSPSQLTDTTEELLSFLRLVKITNTLSEQYTYCTASAFCLLKQRSPRSPSIAIEQRFVEFSRMTDSRAQQRYAPAQDSRFALSRNRMPTPPHKLCQAR